MSKQTTSDKLETLSNKTKQLLEDLSELMVQTVSPYIKQYNPDEIKDLNVKNILALAEKVYPGQVKGYEIKDDKVEILIEMRADFQPQTIPLFISAKRDVCIHGRLECVATDECCQINGN